MSAIAVGAAGAGAAKVIQMPGAGPTQAEKPKKSRLELLLDCEAAMREASDAEELSYMLVNDWRQIIQASQIFLMEADLRSKLKVTHVSDVAKPDARSPLCVDVARLITDQRTLMGKRSAIAVALDKLDAGGEPYPFRYGLVCQIRHPKSARSRFSLMAFAQPPGDGEKLILDRLLATGAHAFALADSAPVNRLRDRINHHRLVLPALLLCLLCGFIPVPMTVLAPVEIVPADPVIVAAPIDGVIERITVEPNQLVTQGDILFTMHDGELNSAFEIASKAADVAEARWRRAQQGASVSADLRREAGLAETEHAAAAAERDAAKARLDRAVAKATQSGTAMFNSKSEWAGKPVKTGEKIIEIADPARIEAAIELGLADSVVLDDPQRITLFMDSNPLAPVSADFISAAYQAMPTRNNTLAFHVRANPSNDTVQQLRLGQRGTAQIRASKVSLAYFLFRRPLSMLRQTFGI